MEKSTNTEKNIVNAARQEFEHKGYSGTRMQKIADVANISKASLHYYFRSKDKLFKKIFDEALDEYLPLIQTWTNESLSSEEKVRQFTADLLVFIQKGSMLFIIREINRNPELLNERIKKSKSPNKIVANLELMKQESPQEIKEIDARFLYIFLHSICCFPTLNKQMYQKTLRLSEKEYNELMKEYAKAAADFFINAIKK